MEKPDLSLIVVDDMESARQVVDAALRNAGHEDIRLASNGKEVMDLLKERRADVVLADWIMPEMDGLTLTDNIRQLDEELNRYTAIILFTGEGTYDSAPYSDKRISPNRIIHKAPYIWDVRIHVECTAQ